MTVVYKQVQQNSLNLTSDNPDNPALEESSSKTGRFAFYQKKASSMNWTDIRDMFKKVSKNLMLF